MLTALFRKGWADVAGRPLQTGLVFLLVLVSTAILATAAIIHQSVDQAFMRRFTEADGAHVWFSYPENRPNRPGPSELERAGEQEGVTATSGTIPYVSGIPLVLETGKVDLRLFGLPSPPAEAGMPLVIQGRWLSPRGLEEIVLDNGLARTRGIEIGDRVEIGRPESPGLMEVVGLAIATDRMPYPYAFGASAYVLPTAMEEIEPDHEKWSWKYGVRIENPDSAEEFARRVLQAYSEDQRPSSTTWTTLRNEVKDWTNYYTMFIVLFGAFAIGVSALIVVNVVAGNMLVHARDVELLKSIGFTPVQVSALFLVEHAGVGLVAATAGVVIGYFSAAPSVLRITANDILGLSFSPVFDPFVMAVIICCVTLAMAVTAFVPAWRRCRIPTAHALSSGPSSRLSTRSLVARCAARLRLPVVAVVGVKDVFNRPTRSVLTVMSLVAVVVLSIFCVGINRTFDDVIEDPRLVGVPAYEMTAGSREGADRISPGEVASLFEGRSEIEAYYADSSLVGWLSGNAQAEGTPEPFQVFIQVCGDGYDESLAPILSEGRLFAEPGEAIISRQMARDRDLRVGETFVFVADGERSRLMEADGEELRLKIVGIFATQGSVNTRIGYRTIEQQLDVDVEPTHYRIKTAQGVDLEALEVELQRKSNDRLTLAVHDFSLENQQIADDIQPPMYSLMAVLMAIGAMSVLLTLLFMVWERRRELGILKSLGFTPRQIMASVVSGSILLAGISLVVGIPLGIAFSRLALDFLGIEIGVGAPFGTMPRALDIAAVAPFIFSIAVLGAALPAHQASRTTVNEALSFE